MSLAIRETCSCGGEIVVASQWASDVRKCVAEWRSDHACPEPDDPTDTARDVLTALGLAAGDVLCSYRNHDGDQCLQKVGHDCWHRGLAWSASGTNLR